VKIATILYNNGFYYSESYWEDPKYAFDRGQRDRFVSFRRDHHSCELGDLVNKLMDGHWYDGAYQTFEPPIDTTKDHYIPDPNTLVITPCGIMTLKQYKAITQTRLGMISLRYSMETGQLEIGFHRYKGDIIKGKSVKRRFYPISDNRVDRIMSILLTRETRVVLDVRDTWACLSVSLPRS
jgi:hypothetical protein